MDGDANIAKVGALVADPARARMLQALGDGRALPASVLSAEAGVAASTASFHPGGASKDRLAAPGSDLDYRLTERGTHQLRVLGIDLDPLLAQRRPLIRYCVDWSEQRHHLAGALGAALAERMLELGWISQARSSRAVQITDRGYAGLRETFGLDLLPHARG